MSRNLKSLPEGLQNTEWEKSTLPVRPPILYVPPTNFHKKQETEQIKVELPNRTKFQMPTYGTGHNKEYLVHIIAILHLVEKREQLSRSRKPLQLSSQSGRR